VHCFRYEEVDLRLLPLPFRDERPVLVVEKVWDASTCPLRAGDRVIAAAGVETRTEGDLARALTPVRLDEEVVVEVMRGGELARLPWVPFRSGPLYAKGTSLRPGWLVDPYLQLDVTFEGYPLDFGEGSRAGETKEGAPLALDLAPGSYLIVLRKEGHVDARLPLWLPKDAGARKVKLYRPDEMPEGFVQIAAGPFPAGGDEGAYEPLIPGREEVGEFFMARHEVTFREYVEFLNDLAEKGFLDQAGTIKPQAEWARPELEGFAPKANKRVTVRPKADEVTLAGRQGGGFAQYSHPEWPVLFVSLHAAVEYGHWLTKRRGGPWRFRPPTDLEWEKAARGADRRTYVWGDRLVRSFARTLHSSLTARNDGRAEDVATHPADESPYGVRDLAGSVSEPTLARALPGQDFFVYRGANWDASSSLDLHAATRNRLFADKSYRFTGIRLVAVPRDR
jgi:formylglycine-generating enzyme required for sulfatase activity